MQTSQKISIHQGQEHITKDLEHFEYFVLLRPKLLRKRGKNLPTFPIISLRLIQAPKKKMKTH